MIYYLLSIVVHFLFCASVVNFIENPDRQYDAETVDKVAKKVFRYFLFGLPFVIYVGWALNKSYG
ncbi:MAG: hypothetical protein MRZ71_03100 [Bacteroidales bacterium]|nr:hypothetical protein [Bacteroidales bacterium]